MRYVGCVRIESLLLQTCIRIQLLLTTSPEPNDGKVFTRRIQASDRATVSLTFTTRDAEALRAMAAAFTLKGDKKASLSLISRRSLQLYLQLIADPTRKALEEAALNRMVTVVPAPAPFSKRKAPQ